MLDASVDVADGEIFAGTGDAAAERLQRLAPQQQPARPVDVADFAAVIPEGGALAGTDGLKSDHRLLLHAIALLLVISMPAFFISSTARRTSPEWSCTPRQPSSMTCVAKPRAAASSAVNFTQ